MDALANIGSFFGSGAGKGLGTLAQLGGTGLGLYSNISADRSQGQELNALKSAQAAETNLTPAQLAAKVSQATVPLSASLVQGVGNQVSGNLAAQGLSQAPGIQASELGQALAPYQQQNQSQALQLVMQQLGLPIEYAQALLANNPKQTNLSPLISMLFRQNNPTPSGGSFTGPGDTQPTLPQLTGLDPSLVSTTTGGIDPSLLNFGGQ